MSVSEQAENLLREIQSVGENTFCRWDDPRQPIFEELRKAGLVESAGAVMSGSWGGEDNTGWWARPTSREYPDRRVAKFG